MSGRFSSALARLPTPAKILLILSLALLPIGLASAWSAKRGLEAANAAIEGRARDQAIVAADAIQNLLSHNRLAARVAANAALANANATLADGSAEACQEVQRILAIAPDVGREFVITGYDGRPVCQVGQAVRLPPLARLAPGDFRSWIAPNHDAVYLRSGVIGGSAIVRVPASKIRTAVSQQSQVIAAIDLIANGQVLPVMARKARAGRLIVDIPLDNGRIQSRVAVDRPHIPLTDQLFIFLPLLMWAAAAIVSWWMVHRMLIRPLRRLQGAIVDYQPGDDTELILPPGLGPATEIHELGGAFQRAVSRIEVAERDALEALDGQRRLVREVHHRVKNNLQVVASLLSIHGRSAEKPEAMAAYTAIGRRVDALSVVHRNHYAELEESRGIALRPLLTELAAGLRSSAPPEARAMTVELDLESPSTTQDVAVAVAFLVTEIVEFAMLRRPDEAVEISLRRNDELTATMSLSSSVLVPESPSDDVPKNQFERIVEGLARQLRSPLQRKLGRYTVTLPVFPEQ